MLARPHGRCIELYKNPKPTVDIAITDGKRVVVVKRKNNPFKGSWVLPGGFVEYGETVEKTAIREAKEETTIDIRLEGILGVYSAPDRDPRGHNISTVFVAEPVNGVPEGGDDAAEAEWREISSLQAGDLAFDHDLILKDLRSWLNQRESFWSTKRRE